jgi:hypothetical protein
MIQNSDKSYVRAYGKLPLIGAVRFTTVNNANPTIVHAAGVETVAWVSEGIWDVTLTNDVVDVLAGGLPFATLGAFCSVTRSAGATVLGLVQVISVTQSTGVIRICHLLDSALAAGTFSVQDDPGVDISVLIYSLEA